MGDMNRAVQIIDRLRQGMESMLKQTKSHEVKCLRMFNFEKRRVSLYMETSKDQSGFSPMGRIDVIEFPGSNQKSGCSCTMTELQNGRTQQLSLRLNNSEERQSESLKVFNFFRNVMDLPDSEVILDATSQSDKREIGLSEQIKKNSESENTFLGREEEVSPITPLSDGMPDSTRGAQEKPPSA